MKRTTYTQEQRDEMKALYLSGMSVIQTAIKMQTDRGTLRREIIEMGILRTKGEAQRLCMGIKYVRSEAFDILTPEALYWIGFLYADGSIEKNVPTVGVALAEVDKGHLEKFNQFLGGGLNITDVTPKKESSGLKGQTTFGGRMFRVKVADRKLYERLEELGFTSNKTYDIIPHEELKHSRDFWRGVIDGDGWLTYCKTKGDYIKDSNAKIYSYPRIGLCGNKSTIDSFIGFVKNHEIITKSSTKKAPRENELYSMDSTGKPALEIMNLLYKDSTVYLDRKYQKYQELLELPNNY